MPMSCKDAAALGSMSRNWAGREEIPRETRLRPSSVNFPIFPARLAICAAFTRHAR
ncbi:MAG: hypothetical protein IH628_18125 [Proteobacteria bacterium]|nr:hypothetical protein [Pseudomonadota bacterium]